MKKSHQYLLGDQLFSQVLNSIISIYTAGRTPALPPCKGIFVVGQPAAGKTLLRDFLLAAQGIISSTIVCNTDDIRTHHPSYEQLLGNPDTFVKAPYLVNEDCSRLTSKLFDFAVEHKYHVLIDATFGASDLSHYFSQVETLVEANYSIAFNVLAVHPRISYLSNYKRYLRGVLENNNERLVAKEVHDLSVNNIPNNILMLSEFLAERKAEITSRIFYRSSSTNEILSGAEVHSLEELSQKVKLEYVRPFTPDETLNFILQCKFIWEGMKKYPIPMQVRAQFEEDFHQELFAEN
jgi:Zeta toxin